MQILVATKTGRLYPVMYVPQPVQLRFRFRHTPKQLSAGVLCGAAASGNFTWTGENVAKSLVCMIMSGPLLTGYTQTINDYYDRELDAINEPYRPIPAGAPPPSLIVGRCFLVCGP